MLSLAILLFMALIVVLFVFDFGTDLKPGIMTRVKILLAHFQVHFLIAIPDVEGIEPWGFSSTYLAYDC